MHDDLLQQGLLKKDKKAASFVTIGEPDVRLHRQGETATVEIAGLEIYDPIEDVVKSRDIHDIAYWMLDDDYDGSNFVVGAGCFSAAATRMSSISGERVERPGKARQTRRGKALENRN